MGVEVPSSPRDWWVRAWTWRSDVNHWLHWSSKFDRKPKLYPYRLQEPRQRGRSQVDLYRLNIPKGREVYRKDRPCRDRGYSTLSSTSQDILGGGLDRSFENQCHRKVFIRPAWFHQHWKFNWCSDFRKCQESNHIKRDWARQTLLCAKRWEVQKGNTQAIVDPLYSSRCDLIDQKDQTDWVRANCWANRRSFYRWGNSNCTLFGSWINTWDFDQPGCGSLDRWLS